MRNESADFLNNDVSSTYELFLSDFSKQETESELLTSPRSSVKCSPVSILIDPPTPPPLVTIQIGVDSDDEEEERKGAHSHITRHFFVMGDEIETSVPDKEEILSGDQIRVETSGSAVSSISSLSRVSSYCENDIRLPRRGGPYSSVRKYPLSSLFPCCLSSKSEESSFGRRDEISGGEIEDFPHIDENLEIIHRRILSRTNQKYLLIDQTSILDRMFTGSLIVLTAAAITVLFWFQNFGPGFKFKHVSDVF